jgi:hypothetical protein
MMYVNLIKEGVQMRAFCCRFPSALSFQAHCLLRTFIFQIAVTFFFLIRRFVLFWRIISLKRFILVLSFGGGERSKLPRFNEKRAKSGRQIPPYLKITIARAKTEVAGEENFILKYFSIKAHHESLSVSD